MIVRGKYNEATIFTDKADEGTVSQVIELCNQEAFKDSKIRIMPDCHKGKGCTIGTTMTIKDKIVPALVGVDIGCGLNAVKLPTQDIDLDKLDKIIRKVIPYGNSVHSKTKESILMNEFNIDLEELRCDIKLERAYKSVGTLGGGNHFLEIDKDNEGCLYLVVHSGSRYLGKQVAEYYQNKAIEYCFNKYSKRKEELKQEAIQELKSKGLEREIDCKIKEINEKFKDKPTDSLCYVEGELMEDYLHDMVIAQKYAEANRLSILYTILISYFEECFTYTYKQCKDKWIQCTHNYINVEDGILRKGAISAKENETVLIPINMRDGIILGKGKGSKDWNYSAPHGAGRILSRTQAKDQVDIEEFKKSMEGIYTTCVSAATLDESPMAYKSIEDILNNITDCIEVVDILKPIYNFKSN